MFDIISTTLTTFKQKALLDLLYRKNKGRDINEQLFVKVDSFTKKVVSKHKNLSDPTLLYLLNSINIILQSRVALLSGNTAFGLRSIKEAEKQFSLLNSEKTIFSKNIVETLELQFQTQDFLQCADQYIASLLSRNDKYRKTQLDTEVIYYQDIVLEDSTTVQAYFTDSPHDKNKVILQGFTKNPLTHELKEHLRILSYKLDRAEDNMANCLRSLNRSDYNKEVRKYLVHPNLLYKELLEAKTYLSFYIGLADDNSKELREQSITNKIRLHTANKVLSLNTVSDLKGEFLPIARRMNNPFYTSYYVPTLSKLLAVNTNEIFFSDIQY